MEPTTYSETRWTSEIDGELKHSTDFDVAIRYHIRRAAVRKRRNELGIITVRPQPPRWNKSRQKRLGTASDARLAEEWGISDYWVRQRRLQLGIAQDKRLSEVYGVSRVHIRLYRALHDIPKAPMEDRFEHRWTAKEDAILGTMSDREAAAQIGVTTHQAMHRRKTLKIPPMGCRDQLRWTAGRVQKLGREPDHVLAAEWKVSPAMVREKRNELGVTACKRTKRALPKELIDLLGTLPDTKLARRFNLSATAVRNLRNERRIPPSRSSGLCVWKSRDLKRLGTVHDDEIAADLGLSPAFVAAKRSELGIPPKRRARRVDWDDPAIRSLLGKTSDGKLAKKLGVTSGAIAYIRRKFGIQPYDPRSSA